MTAEFLAQFWPGLASTVIGGAAFAVLLFWLKEWVFSLPSISGVWECQQTTIDSEMGTFKGMQVWYRVVLAQERERCIGSGEKDREHSVSKNGRYEGDSRIVIEIQGHIEKRYTRSDVIRIHWSEFAKSRRSSTIHELKISGCKHSGNLAGRFWTTAGNSSGFSHWRRVV